MNCEYCGKALRHGDTVHGIKYGTLASNGFIPAKDSAVTVVCGPCGNQVYRFVYASLDERKLSYPIIFNMVNELTNLMRNGYKLIQSISKLPAREQAALKLLVATCKEAR
jgi:hypothetical protein